jgi:L-rhamnose mutarotase
VKRYVRTLELNDDPELIKEYVKDTANCIIGLKIVEGIRAIGILEMEIYL